MSSDRYPNFGILTDGAFEKSRQRNGIPDASADFA